MDWLPKMKFTCFLLLAVISSSLTENASKCGRSYVKSGKVIGGKNATPGEWPWQIALLYEDEFSCGGSLIRPDWVVTASHCVEDDLNATNYQVLLGEHDRNEVDNQYRQKIPAKKVIMHPQYNSPMQLNNDIALIQLKRPAILNKRVNTVCLPKKSEKAPVGGNCFLTGWGKVRHPGDAHPILQKALLPVVSEKHCKEKLKKSEYGDDLKISQHMVCAEDIGTIKSGCHGDSGGPLVCAEKKGIFALHGVVSWGSPVCNISEASTVFARVTEFVDWIEKTIKDTEGTSVKPPQPPTPTTVKPELSSSPKPSPTPAKASPGTLVSSTASLKPSPIPAKSSPGILVSSTTSMKPSPTPAKASPGPLVSSSTSISPSPSPGGDKVKPKTDASGKVLCVDEVDDCKELKKEDWCPDVMDICTKTCHPACQKGISTPRPSPSLSPNDTLGTTQPPTKEKKIQPKTDASGKVLCVDEVDNCEELTKDGWCSDFIDICTKTCYSGCATGKPQPPTQIPTTRQKLNSTPPSKPNTPPHPTPPKPGNGTTPKPGNCGRSMVKQGRIVHGKQAKDGAWPWIASFESDGDHFCGGTLITPNWVMTAAHCVEDIAQDPAGHKNSFKILLGDYDKKNTPAEKKQVRGFTKVIVHETWWTRYENNTWNDIALVKLSSPVILNQRVNIACLPEPGKKPKIGRNCYLAGWGTIKHPSPTTPDVLQQAVLPIVSTDNCQNSHHMICTGFGIVQAANACQGDSGGPLQCQNDDDSWTVHGIASFVKEYCKYYTAFADVGMYRDWIRKFVPETI